MLTCIQDASNNFKFRLSDDEDTEFYVLESHHTTNVLAPFENSQSDVS